MLHRFLLCSGFAALVNLCVGFVLYEGLGLNTPVLYGLSVALAFLSGMGVSFVLNRRFTFEASGRSVRSELTDFLIVSLGGLGLVTGSAVVLATHAGGWLQMMSAYLIPVETAAHLTAVAITAVYSFLAHKHISFRRASALQMMPRPSDRAI